MEDRHQRAIATSKVGRKTNVKAIAGVAGIDSTGHPYLINTEIPAESISTFRIKTV